MHTWHNFSCLNYNSFLCFIYIITIIEIYVFNIKIIKMTILKQNSFLIFLKKLYFLETNHIKYYKIINN